MVCASFDPSSAQNASQSSGQSCQSTSQCRIRRLVSVIASAIRADFRTTEILPSSVSEYLLALPSSETPQSSRDPSAEPHAKRRKVEAGSEPSPISVTKGELSFSRRCHDLALTRILKTVRNAGSYLRLGLRDGRLFIASRSRVGFLSALISLKPQDATENSRKILQFNGYSSKNASPGSIGSVVDMKIERHAMTISVKLFLELLWNETPSPYLPLGSASDRKITQRAIDAFLTLPESSRDESVGSPMDFYDAAYVPPKDDDDSQDIQVNGLRATLFPYQKRPLRWLLAREGMQWSRQDSRPRPMPREPSTSTVDGFRLTRDSDGREIFVSDVFQIVTRDVSLYRKASSAVKGGILAEDMGLGKTLEILSLVLLNPRPSVSTPEEQRLTGPELIPSRATLIVTPESLRPQWLSEIARHAPELRVMHYSGWKWARYDDAAKAARQLAEHEIVITTYAVFSAELHYTLEPPQRACRSERAYCRAMSPLVKISWWRLCLDEAQMIENGYSQAAAVARAIPRVNAWGMTGTPVKDDVKDLFGLLQFLRYEPYCYAPPVWQALIKHHKAMFQQIFRSVALRHTKALVRDEIRLPPQKRYVISMPFTAVEEQHYQSFYKKMAQECSLGPDGVPLVEDWKPEDHEDMMWTWLNRLRQTALHPEVGAYSRRVLGSARDRPMRTVEEVLGAMLEQSENAIRNDERMYLSSRLTCGQLYENSPRVKEA